MLTTVASSEAIPEPSTVTNSTHRPGAEEYESAGASAVVIWEESSRVHPAAGRPACKFSIYDRRRPADRRDRCTPATAHPSQRVSPPEPGPTRSRQAGSFSL